MQKLNLPAYQFSLRENDGVQEILDIVRRKYVKLTPEEWVRQNLMKHLMEVHHYPGSLMAVEREITINRRKKRADVVVFDRQGMPKMVVELKAPKVKISNSSLYQLASYNAHYSVPYILLSNGLSHYCARVDQEGLTWLEAIPNYDEL